MQIEQPRTRWGVILVLILVLGTLAALPFYFLRPTGPLPTYEIQNFIGKVEVFSRVQGKWTPANRGEILKLGDKIRTQDASEVDIRVPDQIRIRIKPNSEAEISKPRLFERSFRYRLHLVRGTLLGNTEKDFEGQRLDISTPVLVAAIRGTSFQIEANPETKKSSVRVLQGTVEVMSVKTRRSVVVRALEKTEVEAGQPPLTPTRISRQEWNQVKEVYELLQKSAAQEARQLDLSKKAGGLFEFVFDHGTFYTPNFGFSSREFVLDPATGEVRLTVDYDVFPAGSFVGVYMKTRDLNIAKFQGISFEVRGDVENKFPDSFKIEFKSGSGVVRSFNPRDLKGQWMTFKFPFKFSRPTSLSEVTIVLSNDKVGSNKKGMIHLRNVELEPRPDPPAAKTASAGTAGAAKTQPAAPAPRKVSLT